MGGGSSLESLMINLGREPAPCCGSPDAPTVLRLPCDPGFSLEVDASNVLAGALLKNPERFSFAVQGFCFLLAPPPASTGFPCKHSFNPPRPPTNHPFAQTTQLLCPAQLPRVRTSPPPPTQPVPPSLITTLAPSGQGQGGTDLCLCLTFSGAKEVFLWTSRNRSKLERPSTGPPLVGPSHSTTRHHLVPGSRVLRQGWEGRQDGRGLILAGLSFWAW